MHSDDEIAPDNDKLEIRLNEGQPGLFRVLDAALSQRNHAMIILDHLYPSNIEPRHLKGFDRALYELFEHHYGKKFDISLSKFIFQAQKHFYEGGNDELTVNIWPMSSAPTSEGLSFQVFDERNEDPLISNSEVEVKRRHNRQYYEVLEFGLDSVHFDSSEYAMLFNTDIFETRDCTDYLRGHDWNGNEAAPDELAYDFCALIVSNKKL